MKANKTNKIATETRAIAESGTQSLLDQALQTYVAAAEAFNATGKALPLELADRTPAQNALEEAMADAHSTAIDVVRAVIDLHTAQAVAAALAAL